MCRPRPLSITDSDFETTFVAGPGNRKRLMAASLGSVLGLEVTDLYCRGPRLLSPGCKLAETSRFQLPGAARPRGVGRLVSGRSARLLHLPTGQAVSPLRPPESDPHPDGLLHVPAGGYHPAQDV